MIVLGKNVSKAKGEDKRSGSYTVLTTDLESNEDGHLAAFEFHVAKAGLIRLQVLVLSLLGTLSKRVEDDEGKTIKLITQDKKCT